MGFLLFSYERPHIRHFWFPIVYNVTEIFFLLQFFPNIPSFDSEIKSALVKFITFYCNSAASWLSTRTIPSENEANQSCRNGGKNISVPLHYTTLIQNLFLVHSNSQRKLINASCLFALCGFSNKLIDWEKIPRKSHTRLYHCLSCIEMSSRYKNCSTKRNIREIWQ